jgi:phosphoglycolate phosphatase
MQAVLFDFDGTLADSYPAIAASVNFVRAQRGLPPLPESAVRVHVGRGPGHLLTHTVGVGDPAENERIYRQHHPTVMRQGTRLLQDVAATLMRLRERGLRLGVCSNKPVAYTRELLEELGVAGCFEAVLGPEDVARPKPAPDMLLACLARLGVPAPLAVYVGDMTVDVTAARAAGLTVWVVPTGSDSRATLEAAGPDRLLESFADLLPVLDSLQPPSLG